MVQKKTVVTLVLMTFISLTFIGPVYAQLGKLTEVASGSMRVRESFTFSPSPRHEVHEGHQGHKTYYWVEILTQPEGRNASVKAYAEGKEIDVFPVSNKEIRVYHVNGGFSLQYTGGTADHLMVSVRVAPYTVGPGGH